jgi:hypothetical protein
MKRFKNHLIAAAVLSVLAIVGTIMNSHQAAAQPPGPPDGLAVRVVNNSPIPVTGTVTGTVDLASGASVRVNNTVADPVRVRNVNDAIQPFQAVAVCSGVSPMVDCETPLLTVPAGKRAVIEYFSGEALLDPQQVALPSLVTAVGTTASLKHFVPPTSPAFTLGAGAAVGTTGWGQQVHLYADPGTVINGSAERSGSGPFTFAFHISGYLVDLPFTP